MARRTVGCYIFQHMATFVLLLVLLFAAASSLADPRQARAFWKRDHSDYSSSCNPDTFSSVPQVGTLGIAPIVLIPGIGGSSLWGQDQPDGPLDHVWVTAQNADCQNINIPYKWQAPSSCSRGCECVIPEHLISKYNSTSGRTESVGGFNVGPAYHGYGLCGVADLAPDMFYLKEKPTLMFLPLIQHLKSMGYVPGANLFGFPYDWRQSNFEMSTLELLSDYISYLHETTGKKVVLVTHSMGGLKTLSYLSTFPQDFSNDVQAWIAIACPFQGAPKTWNSFVQGYNMEITPPITFLGLTGLSNATGHQIVMQFPSVYELLPTPSFPWSVTPTLSFYLKGNSLPLKYTVSNADSVLQNINGLNEITYTFDGKYDKYWNSWQTEVYSNAINNKAKWASLTYTGNPFTFVNIAGNSASTPHSFSYTMQNRLLDTWGSVPEVQWTEGDGTVPIESAFGDSAIQSILSISNYHRHIVTNAKDHVNILQSEETLSILDSYLKTMN